jgi:hypothetical protein
MADYMLQLTPQFYFRARQLILDAKSLLLGEGNLGQPMAIEDRLLGIALHCIAEPKCNLALELHEQGNLPAGHPHPAIRRQFVSSVLDKSPENETDRAMRELASLMLRNIDFLWDRLSLNLSRPEAAPLINSIRDAKAKTK